MSAGRLTYANRISKSTRFYRQSVANKIAQIISLAKETTSSKLTLSSSDCAARVINSIAIVEGLAMTLSEIIGTEELIKGKYPELVQMTNGNSLPVIMGNLYMEF